MAKKPIKYIDGFTESVWKSLVIKSLRVGWTEGINEAYNHIAKSKVETLLISSLFEDVWPYDMEDLERCYQAIKNRDIDYLCSRNTLHGRGYAQHFFNDAEKACHYGPKAGYKITDTIKRQTSITWLNPRIFNCLYTWYYADKNDNDVFRPVCEHAWEGMPLGILDEHTLEGKFKKQKVTLLSGHYENHLAIGNRVMKEGWKPIQDEFAGDEIAIGWNDQKSLF